ncbi:MFS transporter [Cohnella nanjingensis]|uniref:DHA2 family efflux MFS transporter permease subunit n=1 Tax=Cohnella nanjingensis TaxID=1387779 RepID=A0A7X0VDD7_9BACL|nr:MFS transporter [Cohnella nanjingensis]MBB6669877.1 DHA2 family efflux MFS transporter permease subunit [Cohnella nanjingensis]
MTNRSIEAISPRSRGWMLFFLCFGVFMVYLDGTIVNVALSDIQRHFDVGLKGLQWVVDAYLLTFACLQLSSGAIGDVLGPRKVFLAGIVGFTMFSVLCAMAPSLDWLLAGRAFQGVFGAVLLPLSLAMIRRLYDQPAARAKAIGIWSAVGGVALATGPVLGGWLVERFGWQSIFWINLPVGAAVTLALALMRGPAEQRQARGMDAPGQLLFIASIALLAYGLIEGNAWGWGSVRIAGTLGASAVLLLVFVLWELRRREPLFPLGLFRNPVVAVASLANFLGFFGLYGVIFLLTLYWQNANGLSPVETGVRFLSLTASIMVFSYIGGTLAPKLPPRSVIPLGMLFVAGSLAGLLLIGRDGVGYGGYWWALSLLGLGISMCGSSATVALMSAVSPERAGAASGLSNTFRQLSAVFGVALTGAIVSGHIRSAAPGALARLPLPDGAAERLSAQLESGSLPRDALAPVPAESREAVVRESGRLFVDGMHVSLIVAAAATLAGAAIVAALFIASRRRAAILPAGAPAMRSEAAESARVRAAGSGAQPDA